MTSAVRLVRLCEIAGAHGLKGEVRIRSFTGDPLAIGDYGSLADESGRSFTILSAKPGPKGVIAQLAGVATREAAEALAGTALYVARDALPEAAEGEWYHADLIGLAAVGPDGLKIGTIVAVLNFGAGDLLEIGFEGTKQTQLLPFDENSVPEVDIAAGQIRINPPDGWLD